MVCSILQLPDCLAEQAGGEVGWANVWKTQRGAVRSLTNIHIFIGIPTLGDVDETKF